MYSIGVKDDITMKKFICILLAAIIVLSMASTLASCSEKDNKNDKKDDVTVRVGSLNGPTSIGLVNLMDWAEKGKTSSNKYEFTMETQGSTLSAMMVQGTLDIALVPANLAASLYQKTNGGIMVIDINTLGVLYCVTADKSITKMSDLKGKTIVTTGQGTTPEFAIRYLMSALNIDDYNLDFKSEATEVSVILSSNKQAIGILPQPFVTVTTAQHSELNVAFSLSDEWENVTSDSKLVTGVTIVRKEFYEEHKEAVEQFIKDHKESANAANEDLYNTASLTTQYGIIGSEGLAKLAIPYCNVVCITGETMKTTLSGYLKTLYDLAPNSIGGKMPDDAFYLK